MKTNQFLRIVVERDAPRLVWRRRAAQDVLEAGRNALSAVLSAYAQCLAYKRWPSFEDPDDHYLGAWTETHVESWTTAAAGAEGGFFAPHGAERLAATHAHHAKD